MDFISLCSLSAPPLLFPLLFSLSPRLVLSYVSYQELVLWSGPELSSGYEIRFFFLSKYTHGNTTKVPVRAQLQKWTLNGAVIMMYSLQDIDVPPCSLVISVLTAGQLLLLSSVWSRVHCVVCTAY